MTWDKINKTELLKTTRQEWNNRTQKYNWLLLVPTRKKHDSGFACFTVIGERIDNGRLEQIAWGDDLQIGGENILFTNTYQLRIDCGTNGVLRIWSNYYYFQKGISGSSTEVCLIKRK